MFLSALVSRPLECAFGCEFACGRRRATTNVSGGKPSRAEPSRAEPSRAELSQAKLGRGREIMDERAGGGFSGHAWKCISSSLAWLKRLIWGHSKTSERERKTKQQKWAKLHKLQARRVVLAVHRLRLLAQVVPLPLCFCWPNERMRALLRPARRPAGRQLNQAASERDQSWARSACPPFSPAARILQPSSRWPPGGAATLREATPRRGGEEEDNGDLIRLGEVA